MEGNDGGAAVKKVEYPTSRIHEEDVIRAILHAMSNPDLSEAGQSCIWNLADDDPAPRSEVMVFGSNLLHEAGITPFPERAITHVDSEEEETHKGQQSQREKRRKTDKKRVCNRRMKSELLPDGKLIYPTYREGLRSVLNNNKDAWVL
jgi:nucleoside-diphosphate-sugar epimerase